MTTSTKREHIINTAMELFYKDGFHATGVEKIIKHAKVSKKTLYNHFRSKDELILATLRKSDELLRNDFMRTVESLTKDPIEQLSAIFDALEEWFKDRNFYGCIFINAAAEFSDHENPGHIVCAEHKRLMFEYVRDVAKRAGAKNPTKLAEQINLLAEGAIVNAHVGGDKNAAQTAKQMALFFIEQEVS